ncbi:MAG: hypothetical protein IJB44_02825 [Clostridia bacterium]|nr:hypothetical protein [Clostridia bacterium]
MKNVCKILAVLMLLTLFIGCSQETPEEFDMDFSTKTVAAILEEQSSVVEQCFTEYVEVALSAYDVLFGK